MTKTRPILAKWLKPLAFSRSGKTGQAAAFGLRAESSMVNVANGSKVAVAAAGLALAGFGGTTEGSLVRDPFSTWDPIARQNAASYLAGGSVGGGAVALRIFDGASGTRNTSAIFLGNYTNPATGTLQPLFITAYHNYADFIGAPQITMSIRTGSNYLTSPGQVVNITSSRVYTNSGSRDWSRPDAMWLWGDVVVNGSNANFGTPSTTLALASFSRPGSQTSGLLAADGFARAVFSRFDVSGGAPIGFNTSIYDQAECRPDDLLAGLGRETPLGSGGAVFNQLVTLPDGSLLGGELVGMTVAGTNGTSFSGTTTFMSFDTAEFHQEFQSVSGVPSPGATSLLALAGGLAMRRRR